MAAINGNNKKKRIKKAPIGKSKVAGNVEGTDFQDGNVTSQQSKETAEQDETLWRTFYTHPVVVITTLIAIPYVLYTLRLYLILQRPDILNVATSEILGAWRPAVSVNDTRQVLIVGSMSSGTTQMSRAFGEAFDDEIEIGHENSDSAWYFVRDGTISWLHALRFFPFDQPENVDSDNNVATNKRRLETTLGICGNGKTVKRSFDSIGNMGFHPSMYKEVRTYYWDVVSLMCVLYLLAIELFYMFLFDCFTFTCQPQSKCSYRVKAMNACWTISCLSTVHQEYGCEIRGDCEVNFQRKLFQARNPFRVVESLMVKFCDDTLQPRQLGHVRTTSSEEDINATNLTNKTGGNNATEATVPMIESVLHAPFLIFAQALFQQDREAVGDGASFLTDSCLHAVSYYVLRYHQIMLDALDKGYVDQMYRIEDSSVCDVVGLAGFNNSATVVYPPHHDAVRRVCHKDSFSEATLVIKQEANPINVEGHMRLGWQDLKSVGMEDAYRDLFRRMGYALEAETETGTVPPCAKGDFDKEEGASADPTKEEL
jgi:hypothetical protein